MKVRTLFAQRLARSIAITITAWAAFGDGCGEFASDYWSYCQGQGKECGCIDYFLPQFCYPRYAWEYCSWQEFQEVRTYATEYMVGTCYVFPNGTWICQGEWQTTSVPYWGFTESHEGC